MTVWHALQLPTSKTFIICILLLIVSLESLETTGGQLKKSPPLAGYYETHISIQKELFQLPGSDMLKINSKTLEQGIFTNSLNKTIMISNFKGGDRRKHNNYRLISIHCFSV